MHAGARDVVIHGFANAACDHAARQVGNGSEADEGGEQERGRCEDDRSPDAAGLARYGGEEGCSEG